MARTVDGIVTKAVQDTFNNPVITKQTIVNANNQMIQTGRRRAIKNLSQRLVARKQIGVAIPRPTQSMQVNTAPVQAQKTNIAEEVKFRPFWLRVREFFGIKIK